MDKKEPRVYFHPDVLKGLDDETAAHVVAEMASVLLPGGTERLMANSRAVEEAPGDGNCPECGVGLVPDAVWDDEAECPNPQCANHGNVAFLTDPEFVAMLKRRQAEMDASP